MSVLASRGAVFAVRRDTRWLVAAVAVAALVVMPVAAVLWLALNPVENIWPHLVRTVLGHYVYNTVVLMLGVGAAVLVTGVSTAWLVTMCRFPAGASSSGCCCCRCRCPPMSSLTCTRTCCSTPGPCRAPSAGCSATPRAGTTGSPEVRSLGGAIMLMGLVLYPYVFLLARAAFWSSRPPCSRPAASSGRGPWRTFFSVSLPVARPSIAVGVALALMETLNDFGTVDYFAVRTLTAGIYDTWLGMGNLGGAAQIASLMLLFVMALIGIERFGRRNIVYYQQGRQLQPLPGYTLQGWKKYGAVVACSLPVLAGFVVPMAVLGRYAVIYFGQSWTPDFRDDAANSFILSALAAFSALAVALLITYARRLHGRGVTAVAARLAGLGYAVPGAVLAIGVIVPFAAFDNAVDALVRQWLGVSTGLLLSGTVFAIIFAYVVRFLAVAIGRVESSLGKVSPSMDMAARTLGFRPLEVLLRHHLPLIRGGMLAAALIVFVDCMKELPATLILRPFNFETLATGVYQLASDERIGEAALGSLTIVLVGPAPVVLLSRTISRARRPG
ncbi:MAG: iron ABC transporter permease [Gammaproteobacteria bacterium]|nr:iron ABC transporter permease [Gammaproteobacteria bacterium]